MEMTAYDAFFWTIFKSLHFHVTTLETESFKTMRFQKAPLLKPFSEASVFISVVDHFSTDDRQW